MLVHLVEPSPVDGTDPIENYRAIRAELKQYDVDLADRPEVVAVSKGELPGAEEVRERLAKETGGEVLLFSSVTGEGLNALMARTYELLQQSRKAEAEKVKKLAGSIVDNSKATDAPDANNGQPPLP